MTEKCLQKLTEERDTVHIMVETFAKSPTPGSQLFVYPSKRFVEHHDEIIKCYEEGKPFITSYFCCAPEIYTAMNLPWNTFLTPAFTGAILPTLHDEIDASARMLGNDLCTIIRLAAYYVEEDLVPPPTAVVAMVHPCDGITVVHQVMAQNEKWSKIPVFAADPPYWEDERSIDYYADELKRMVDFLEEHSGLKLDVNRLREVIEESNRQFALWQEWNDLRRVVPCPHGGAMALEVFGAATTMDVGMPEGTAWLKEVVADAESLVRQGKGPVEKERIRLLWFDVLSLGLTLGLFPWLEQEWGAVIVMEMFGYSPYTQIDTSSEDSMFKGLAKRALHEVPMIRQARGVADYFLSDIERIVKDYKIDAVIWPAYMGHKDGSANTGLMREKCRELGVSYLHIGMDLFDDRYTTLDQLKDRFSMFFTAMGLG